MPMTIRPTKEQAIKVAIELTPQYAEWIKELQRSSSQRFFSQEVNNIQSNLGKYVLMYDDERKIGRAFFLFLLGSDGLQDLCNELSESSQKEQQEWLDDLVDGSDEIASMFDNFQIPDTPDGWKLAREELAKLTEEERKEAERKGSYFWCFTFSSFFNTLSLMVHGIKLTTLVPQAIAGNDIAYLKAIQIGRLLLLNYPYFRDRKFKAQDERDTSFLSQISYRESNSPLRGKIRYPALYMLFGILETYGWLDDLNHEEILDICDSAGLDRFQNRVEDVGYLTKRLIDYRKWQNSGGLSMH